STKQSAAIIVIDRLQVWSFRKRHRLGFYAGRDGFGSCRVIAAEMIKHQVVLAVHDQTSVHLAQMPLKMVPVAHVISRIFLYVDAMKIQRGQRDPELIYKDA